MKPDAKAPDVQRTREDPHLQVKELCTHKPLSDAFGPEGSLGPSAGTRTGDRLHK